MIYSMYSKSGNNYAYNILNIFVFIAIFCMLFGYLVLIIQLFFSKCNINVPLSIERSVIFSHTFRICLSDIAYSFLLVLSVLMLLNFAGFHADQIRGAYEALRCEVGISCVEKR